MAERPQAELGMAERPSAEQIIQTLNLVPHPEGGFFVETFRDPLPEGQRGHSTAIYFLLKAGQRSHWHKVDASEVFHHYLGAPVEVRTWKPGAPVETRVLGTNLAAGARPQVVIEAGEWQTESPLADPEFDYALVGCTVAPAFEFRGFELAPVGWEPNLGGLVSPRVADE
jgi:uncharacterized protein